MGGRGGGALRVRAVGWGGGETPEPVLSRGERGGGG